MVSDAIKKYRDVFAFGLLAVATLYLIAGLSLLFKSEEDSFLDFPGRAAQTSYLFSHPLVIIALATAVALAIGLGQASANARGIVVGALIIGGACLALGVVSWFASFAYDGSGFGGVITAGKIVAIFLGLAQLLALGLTLFFAVVALQTLPKRVPQQAQQWGAPPNYGQQQWGQHAGQQPWGQPPQQPWGQPPQQQWGQQPPQQQWGQPERQSWGQHVDPQQAWPQPEQQQGWAQPEQQQSWGQPGQQQAWAQPEQQQPEQQQAWAQPEQQQPEQQQPEQAWGQREQPDQSWGQPAGQEAQSWETSEPADAEMTTVSESLGAPADEADQPDEAGDGAGEEPEEGQQDGWWQRPSQ